MEKRTDLFDILKKVKTTGDFKKLTKEELIDYALVVTHQRNSLQRELDEMKKALIQLDKEILSLRQTDTNDASLEDLLEENKK